MCVFGREDAIDDKFDQFQGSSFGAGVAGVTDSIATICYACSVRVHLLGAVITDNSCVCDVSPACDGNGVVGYRTESICALNSFVVGVHGIPTNTLTELPKFIGVRFVPHRLIFRIVP